MAIKGKKMYSIYLDEDDAEFLKAFLEKTKNKGGLSAVMNGHLRTMCKTLRAAGYNPNKKLTVAKLLRIFKEGITQEPL